MFKDYVIWNLERPYENLKIEYDKYSETALRRGKNVLNYEDWNKKRITEILARVKNKKLSDLLIKDKNKWKWKE